MPVDFLPFLIKPSEDLRFYDVSFFTSCEHKRPKSIPNKAWYFHSLGQLDVSQLTWRFHHEKKLHEIGASERASRASRYLRTFDRYHVVDNWKHSTTSATSTKNAENGTCSSNYTLIFGLFCQMKTLVRNKSSLSVVFLRNFVFLLKSG